MVVNWALMGQEPEPGGEPRDTLLIYIMLFTFIDSRIDVYKLIFIYLSNRER